MDNKDLSRLVAAIRLPRERRHDFSKENWQKHWLEEGRGVAARASTPDYKWICGREIRVFRMPDVDEGVVGPVIDGVNELICDVGLPGFLIDRRRHYFGPHESAMQEVKAATRVDGFLDGKVLRAILVAEDWRDPSVGGKPHADIIITAQHIALGAENWGQSEFSGGYAIISVPGTRQRALGFIRNIAKHEAGHLFGFRGHHDDSDDIPGYAKDADCNMLWEAPSSNTCGRCMDALVNFWKGIEEGLGKRFRR